MANYKIWRPSGLRVWPRAGLFITFQWPWYSRPSWINLAVDMTCGYNEMPVEELLNIWQWRNFPSIWCVESVLRFARNPVFQFSWYVHYNSLVLYTVSIFQFVHCTVRGYLLFIFFSSHWCTVFQYCLLQCSWCLEKLSISLCLFSWLCFPQSLLCNHNKYFPDLAYYTVFYYSVFSVQTAYFNNNAIIVLTNKAMIYILTSLIVPIKCSREHCNLTYKCIFIVYKGT